MLYIPLGLISRTFLDIISVKGAIVVIVVSELTKEYAKPRRAGSYGSMYPVREKNTGRL
jgi:hypothetical protein